MTFEFSAFYQILIEIRGASTGSEECVYVRLPVCVSLF